LEDIQRGGLWKFHGGYAESITAPGSDQMEDDAVHQQVAERVLRSIDGLAEVAGFGSVSTVLVEFETASVAVARAADGAGCLIKTRSPSAAAQVLMEARRRAGVGRTASPPADGPAESYSADDDLEVAQASLQPAGQAVTATVELVHGGRRVVATSTGRNAAERHLYLMAEAAARAVTEFLPVGYGVILGEITQVPEELGGALRAAVLFMTPTEDRALEGIAAVAGRPETAAARTVLAAVSEHVRPLLSHTGDLP
jgi:hypothetical protein